MRKVELVGQRYFDVEGSEFVDHNGLLPLEQGTERFSWKKLLINLGLIAAGGATGLAVADVALSIGIQQIDSGVLQFGGVMIGMIVGGLTAELSTAKMPGTIYF